MKAHLYPEPRCQLGRWLQRAGIPSALMDISDGLSTDLVRMCEASGVGAKVDAGRIPGPAGVTPEHSLELALNGGEDYELLFAVPRRKVRRSPEPTAAFRSIVLARCTARGTSSWLIKTADNRLSHRPATIIFQSKGIGLRIFPMEKPGRMSLVGLRLRRGLWSDDGWRLGSWWRCCE